MHGCFLGFLYGEDRPWWWYIMGLMYVWRFGLGVEDGGGSDVAIGFGG